MRDAFVLHTGDAVLFTFAMLCRPVNRTCNAMFGPAINNKKVSEKDVARAREARLKRFQEQKSSYAEIMKEAAGGWKPGDVNVAASSSDGSESLAGLRKRGGGSSEQSGL